MNGEGESEAETIVCSNPAWGWKAPSITQEKTMPNVKENDLQVDEGVRGYLRVTQEMELTTDEIAELFDDIPQIRRLEIIMAMIKNAEGVIEIMKEMGVDDRLQVMGEFCKHCGHVDPRCPCVRDD